MMNRLRLIQGSPEWHAHRLMHRNASETAAVMGLSPWLTPYRLWEIKTGRSVQEMTYPMQRGTELEPQAREAYELGTNRIMEPAVVVHEDYSASLDGISFDEDLILEIKCPLKGKESETWRMAATGLVERHYELQIQHQLMVSGAMTADFWVFNGKEGICVEVVRNKDDFYDLHEAWEKFMVYVNTDTPPPVTSEDTITRQDEAWKSAAQLYLRHRQTVDEASRLSDEAKAKLVALTQHSSERGFGVSVCRFRKGKAGAKEGVRVTAVKQEEQRC